MEQDWEITHGEIVYVNNPHCAIEEYEVTIEGLEGRIAPVEGTDYVYTESERKITVRKDWLRNNEGLYRIYIKGFK